MSSTSCFSSTWNHRVSFCRLFASKSHIVDVFTCCHAGFKVVWVMFKKKKKKFERYFLQVGEVKLRERDVMTAGDVYIGAKRSLIIRWPSCAGNLKNHHWTCENSLTKCACFVCRSHLGKRLSLINDPDLKCFGQWMEAVLARCISLHGMLF